MAKFVLAITLIYLTILSIADGRPIEKDALPRRSRRDVINNQNANPAIPTLIPSTTTEPYTTEDIGVRTSSTDEKVIIAIIILFAGITLVVMVLQWYACLCPEKSYV
ncbi:uncharacterized protein [Clytia hemisphaerica]|uniref:Cnidarian restricted protein n=1 Tax=Clytia hemisphaerica TaxID=252671 RepID=A0A7M5X0K3_9CNID